MIRARKKTPKNGANITVENDTLHLMWIDLNRNFSIISKNLFIALLSIYRYSKEGCIKNTHFITWNSLLARVLLAFRIFLHQIFFRIDIFWVFFPTKSSNSFFKSCEINFIKYTFKTFASLKLTNRCCFLWVSC